MELIAEVNEQGTAVRWESREAFLRTLEKHAGKRIVVTFKKPREKRTLDMNAYLHKWPFPLLADYFGDSVEGVKYDLMGEFFGWVKGPVSGHLIPVKAHTSDMTKEESGRFVEWLIPFGAKHGVKIPLPNEAPLDDEDEG